MSDIGDDRLNEAQEYFQEAYMRQMRGELDAAIKLYKKSLAVHPTAEAYTFLGWTYSFQGRLDEAIEECKRAIEVDPDFGNPYNDIGAYLIQKQQFDDAIPWLEKATRAVRYEAHHFPRVNLGRVYEAQARLQDALREYEAALEIEEHYQPALQGVARVKGFLN